jgi:hypothetical protein
MKHTKYTPYTGAEFNVHAHQSREHKMAHAEIPRSPLTNSEPQSFCLSLFVTTHARAPRAACTHAERVVAHAPMH